MTAPPSNVPPDEAEQVSLLDVLACLADRSIRLDAVKYQIEEVHRSLSTKLGAGSPRIFEAVGLGLKRCGICLAFKAPMYATLAGLLTADSEPYAKDLANKLAKAVSKSLADAIRDGQAGVARRALRFLSCLGCSSMVSPISVAEYILVLLDAALYEMTKANRSPYGVHCRGEFLADIALSALPWAAGMLVERAPEELKRIVDLICQISEAWRQSKWRCVAPGTDARCMESFSELLECISLLQDAEWVCPENVIPRPYKEFELQLGGGHEVVLDALTIPGHSKLTRYSAPRFRLFLVNAKPKHRAKKIQKEEVKIKEEPGAAGKGNQNMEDIEVVEKDKKKEGDTADVVMLDDESKPANGDAENEKDAVDPSKPSARTLVEKYVLRSYIADVVDNFSSNHVMAAEKLLTIPTLKSADDEIVEGLFSQLCALPEPTFAPVYYGTLFVDLCRVKDSRLPIKLLTAVEAIFQDAGQFDPESFDRLTEWFSFHLSNFEYKWNWSDWAVYADAEMVDKFPYRALFCKDVLARCIRLSYYQRIVAIIPKEMGFFLPPTPGDGDRSRFNNSVNDILMTVVTGKDKQEASVVKDRLATLIPVESNEDDDQEKAVQQANSTRLASLIRAILQAGCKTLSHFDTVAERYLSLLLEMVQVGGVPAKRLVTLEVSFFWRDVHIRRMYVLDKLSMNRVIDGLAIIDSALSEDRPTDTDTVPLTDEELKANLAESSSWEIVRVVMQRARAREEGARAELTAASKAAAAASEGDTEKAELRLEQAKAGTETAKREISELLLLAVRRLFDLCGRLIGDDDVMVMKEEEMDSKVDQRPELPGFDGRPVWYWRCLGMIRELGRKHPRQLTTIIERLENDTKTIREKHKSLWDTFEILREVEASALLPQVL